MSAEENDSLSLQADEIEALTAIFGKDWKVEDASRRVYSITISGATANQQVLLQVTLPPHYPLDGPPLYQLSAPWMKSQDKVLLSSELEDIYCQHVGESILYLWVEKITDFLEKSEEKTDEKEETAICVSLDEDMMHLALFDKEENLSLLHKIGSTIQNDELPPIYHGEPIVDRRSTFQAHLAPIVTIDQVQQVLCNLKENRKIACATHNMYAYRIYLEPKQTYIQDCDDDGETHAGSRLLHLLEILNVHNVLVVVSRWYGGILLGPDRFKHINNAARNILLQCNYVQTQTNLPETAKSKKKKGK